MPNAEQSFDRLRFGEKESLLKILLDIIPTGRVRYAGTDKISETKSIYAKYKEIFRQFGIEFDSRANGLEMVSPESKKKVIEFVYSQFKKTLYDEEVSVEEKIDLGIDIMGKLYFLNKLYGREDAKRYLRECMKDIAHFLSQLPRTRFEKIACSGRFRGFLDRLLTYLFEYGDEDVAEALVKLIEKDSSRTVAIIVFEYEGVVLRNHKLLTKCLEKMFGLKAPEIVKTETKTTFIGEDYENLKSLIFRAKEHPNIIFKLERTSSFFSDMGEFFLSIRSTNPFLESNVITIPFRLSTLLNQRVYKNMNKFIKKSIKFLNTLEGIAKKTIQELSPQIVKMSYIINAPMKIVSETDLTFENFTLYLSNPDNVNRKFNEALKNVKIILCGKEFSPEELLKTQTKKNLTELISI